MQTLFASLRTNLAAIPTDRCVALPGDPCVAGIATEVQDASLATAVAAEANPNAELLASLPPSQLEPLLPPALPLSIDVKAPSWLGVLASLTAGPWRDTLRGGAEYNGDLIRHESLRKTALGGAQGADTQVVIGPAATAKDLADKARHAGLTDAEAKKLEAILRDGGHLDTDAPLVTALLESGNAARALRTFIDLDPMRQANPARITPDVVRALTLGVGQARTEASEGREGILSRDSALAAARALVAMRPADYNAITLALNNAGGGSKFAAPLGADAMTERALILKAVAYREEVLSKCSVSDYFDDRPSFVGADIAEFARQIRGTNAHGLIERTSGLDLDGDGIDEALQQKWQNGSAAAVLQAALAEADPIYAWELHNDLLHDTPESDAAGSQQAVLISDAGGRATERTGERGGGGDLVVATMTSGGSSFAGVDYQHETVSFGSRASAVDHIELLVKNGADVPIAVCAAPGQRQAMLITDVRGTGNSRQFLVTDPWNGRTQWVSRDDLVNGTVGDTGASLTDYWW